MLTITKFSLETNDVEIETEDVRARQGTEAQETPAATETIPIQQAVNIENESAKIDILVGIEGVNGNGTGEIEVPGVMLEEMTTKDHAAIETCSTIDAVEVEVAEEVKEMTVVMEDLQLSEVLKERRVPVLRRRRRSLHPT